MNREVILLTVPFLLMWHGCSSVPELTSHSAVENITVDGSDEDWQSGLTPIESLKSSVGFQNNGDNLFVCLKTVDRGVEMQILRGGLTVWLDSTGGKEKTFGIRFPLELTGVPRGEGNPEQRIEHMVLQPMLECEVLGVDRNDRQRVPVSSSSGINASVGFHHGVLVYELAVSLSRGLGTDHALSWNKNSVIGVGFETQAPSRPEAAIRPEPEPGIERGGQPREGMGRHSGRGRGSSEGRPQAISGWVAAKLTTGN